MQISLRSYPAALPVIVEDELFLYPFMIVPLFLSDEANVAAADAALSGGGAVFIATSKAGSEGERHKEAIFEVGVIGNIMRKITLPDGKVKILFQGQQKGKILDITSQNPLIAQIDTIATIHPDHPRTEALLSVLKEKSKELSHLSHFFLPDLLQTIEDSTDAVRVCDLISSAMRFKKNQAASLFGEADVENRILSLIDLIADEIHIQKIQRDIKTKVHSKIDKNNKEYFLKEQLKEIQKELGSYGERDEEIEQYKEKLEAKKPFMEAAAATEIKKQINRLSRMHPDGSEASMIASYLDWALDLPFGKLSKKPLSVAEVAKQLDSDHYGLDKPKKRVVEYFGLRELLEQRGLEQKVQNGVILCFVGPPGVGKTSLANSIAKALKRELVRIALGGLEDVNELRGHRRTYIGAMPGRIAQGLIEAKTFNPVIVLDEIDKIARSYKGDPTAVLLEILDPEQNSKFRDYYLNFNIDLSKIIFVATANDASLVPPALKDRMEFINLSSYTPQEKLQIAKKYLIPNEMQKHGLKPADVAISTPALNLIISDYTRESGVRNLRRKIADILRKTALQIVQSGDGASKVAITPKNIGEFLDKKVFEIDAVKGSDEVGIVNGLAWTAVGGDVLSIEVVRIKGKGELKITGQLGDVMKESAQIAFSLVKTLIDRGEIKVPKSLLVATQIDKNGKKEQKAVYDSYDLHIHVPEGATPKDGPSAGITMSVAIASILSDTPAKKSVAMTGEITLRGRVLPIGGLKEKLIAAFKAGIKTVLIPRKNYDRDLDEIPDEVKNKMQIIAVERIEEVLKHSLASIKQKR